VVESSQGDPPTTTVGGAVSELASVSAVRVEIEIQSK